MSHIMNIKRKIVQIKNLPVVSLAAYSCVGDDYTADYCRRFCSGDDAVWVEYTRGVVASYLLSPSAFRKKIHCLFLSLPSRLMYFLSLRDSNLRIIVLLSFPSSLAIASALSESSVNSRLYTSSSAPFNSCCSEYCLSSLI